MHKYRTHKCDELRSDNVKDIVKLSGWVHRKRDHGQLIFIDLRDHYGLTQVVVDSSNNKSVPAPELNNIIPARTASAL